MIHISGAMTACEMWNQLALVKESKGRLGVLATHRALYRASAEEGFDMVDHISHLQKLQEELHLMDNKVNDEDFVMILITSLPESWDNYTSSYLGSSSNKPTLSSHKLIAILMEEDQHRKGQSNESVTSLQGKGKVAGKSTKDSSVECYNCHKTGHMLKDCWAKGGGKEGQGLLQFTYLTLSFPLSIDSCCHTFYLCLSFCLLMRLCASFIQNVQPC